MHLAMVYSDYGEALEWDLFRFWGKDINDEDLTVRRLWNFYSRLGSESETLRDIAGIPWEGRQWSTDTFMLATIVDALSAVDWHIVAAFSKNAPKTPKPYPRPQTQRKTPAKKNWPGKTIVVPKENVNG
jgi:hypothetical protein